MSVIVTGWFMADPEKWEQVAQEKSELVQALAERAKEAGVIAHRFYGSEGQVMVIDEWPDEESFQGYFDSVQDEVGPLLAEIGSSEPQIRFWRVLDTPDKVGWGA
jgi:quinol monooxygenase YgiN